LTGRILVVDDESIIRTFLAEGLTDAGYQVVTARDGAEALDRVQQYRPDAVLLDLLMPVHDGFTFLRERRVQPALAAVPVVVFSAAGREGLHDASTLRANAVLPKPLDLEVLSAVLEHLLNDAQRTQAAPALLDSLGAAGTSECSSVNEDLSVLCSHAEDLTVAGARRIGTCPICGIDLFAEIDASLPVPARIRAIHAVRRRHVLAHTARDIARVPLRTRVLQMPVGQRQILADWLYRELRHQWGDKDRRGAHSIEETLGSVGMHRLWQDAERCAYPRCPHGD
jgi:CheY-like chemotaxis protein